MPWPHHPVKLLGRPVHVCWTNLLELLSIPIAQKRWSCFEMNAGPVPLICWVPLAHFAIGIAIHDVNDRALVRGSISEPGSPPSSPLHPAAMEAATTTTCQCSNTCFLIDP